MTLAEYSRVSVRALMDSLSREARKAEQRTTDEGIHDLRVAIRRLSENLRVFQDLFPRGAAKRVRADLRVAMKLAGDARSHDIALVLMEKAEVPVPAEFPLERERASVQLTAVLRGWNHANAFRAWREQLHV